MNSSFGPGGFGTADHFPSQFAENFRSFHGGDVGNFFQQIIRNMQRAQEEGQRRPADTATVNELPVVEVEEKHCKRNDDGKLEMPTCPVCVEELSLGKKAMFMPCGHSFDPDCLMPWLKDHNTCPVCRHELPTQHR